MHLLSITLVVLLTVMPAASLSDPATPSTAVSTDDITSSPDAFAWRIFEEINAPVRPGEPFGPVQWERWALAQRAYPVNPDPRSPPTWEMASAPGEFEPEVIPLQLAVRAGGLASDPRPLGAPAGHGQALPDPAILARQRNETRLNRDSFDFVISNGLFYVEGQEQFFNSRTRIAFPRTSREVKAQWRRIEKEDASRYHTRKIANGGQEEYWGLTAIHVTTRDLPNWFWATWEHKNNEGIDSVVPSRSITAPPATLPQMWRDNYVLRGTQIDFVDSTGTPTILANSQIERGFQDTSSCITCHSRASIGPKPALEFGTNQDPDAASRLAIFDANGNGFIGRPDPSWFNQSETLPTARRFIQTDFVWSTFRAKRAQPLHPRPILAPLVGKWRYRSFRNDATVDDVQSLLFGDGSFTLRSGSTPNTLVGDADFGSQSRLQLVGAIVSGSPAALQFRGTGVPGTSTADWIYDYAGYLIPDWPNGIDQTDAIVGSVVRTVRHGNSPAGLVASFIMVRDRR